MPNSNSLHVLDRAAVTAAVTEPVTAASLAFTVTTPVSTDAPSYRFPIVTGAPDAVWLREGDTIPLSEATASEVTVTPRKIAGLSRISRELADDTSPEATATIGKALALKLAGSIDAAFFGPKPANGSPQPGGLEALTDLSIVAAAPNALDPFIVALSAAESAGATVSHWVTTPEVAASLARLTVAEGSRQPLFGTDATNGIERRILGVPVLTSPHVVAGTVWGLDSSTSYTVLRNDVEIDVDYSFYFDTHSVAIRAVARVGFGFPQPTTVVKIKAGG